MNAAPTPAILLEFQIDLVAPIGRVFEALTVGDDLARWFCDEAESHAAPGGRLVLRWRRADSSALPFAGAWVVYQPPAACAYEGGHSGYPDGYAGRVEFELAPRAAGTALITRHRLPARPEYEPIATVYRDAWPRALARLSALLGEAR